MTLHVNHQRAYYYTGLPLHEPKLHKQTVQATGLTHITLLRTLQALALIFTHKGDITHAAYWQLTRRRSSPLSIKRWPPVGARLYFS